ncbi:hypothetical protein [Pseudoalteromonas prydzensis]|uniref:hypothetical protein n=1 Tax=Pseudoalteromonas prydzensis TaxID=182141 RepID=UPI0007E5216F|nr:hypothetical protein [Pseudoalteromonas prydzensis]MBE0380363.1 hypothetical protein [Pseudoalteromonas prydzensis ACAM 620]
MGKEIAIITLHGMGDYKPNYYEELKSKLVKALDTDWQKVAFEPVQYQPILQNNQNDIWQRMNRFPLDGSILRRFLLFGFSDAGSLEYSARSNVSDQYIKVQKEIMQALDKVYIELGGNDKPVIIIAQSLGCQVISNYIWDAKKGSGIFNGLYSDASDQLKSFRRLESCVHLLTTGCNIPMFVGGLAPIEAIQKPNDAFTWYNYFDRDDVLGWPLSPLSDSYNALVIDHEINAGGIFSSWNPWSHGKYWTDKDVIKPLIKKIRSYIIA